jgi:hypothetical protein
MNTTALLDSSTHDVRKVLTVRGSTCRFASNCSCVFQPGRFIAPEFTAAEPTSTDLASRDDLIAAEIRRWTDLGWSARTTTPDEVILERQRNLPFCLNAFLTLATGFLWLIYWIPRSRHPKIETKILDISAFEAASAS